MCGILGVINNQPKESILKALDRIKHRGPDDSGTFFDGKVGLAHQRLSILDLSSNGHQPMLDSEENLVIIFNGEIYNHMDIRKNLAIKYNFKSSSDTETILYGYKEYGLEIFKKLNGIFAVAIYDTRKRELVLARDHFGVKPFYYYNDGSQLIFGSELKSFLDIPYWDKSIDHSAIVNYTHFLWSPGRQTPFKNIEKLEAGHYIVLQIDNLSKAKKTKYYEIPFDNQRIKLSEEEWITKTDKAFTLAVERQMLSDVPVGFFLSGGLDSSLIVAKARELTGKKLDCYTIETNFDEAKKEGFADDLAYAKKVANHLDLNLHIIPSKVNIVDDFDKMIWHLDEPQSDAAPLQVLNISQAARANGNVVLLGGAGGDDLFSGYRRHQALNFEKFITFLPGKLSKKLTGYLPSGNPTFRRISKLFKDADKPLEERLAGYYEWLELKNNLKLLTYDVRGKIGNYNPANMLLESLANIKDEKEALNKLLYWDMKYFLTDHNLNYTDKLSMAVGVEARVPFLDLDLVNLSTKIPVDLKLKGNTAKYILKKVGEKYLPNEVICRPKTGFGAPVRKWITQDMDEMIHEYLAPKKIEERGIYDSKAVWKLIRDNKKGKIDASYPIWGLLAVESWMRQFVDNK